MPGPDRPSGTVSPPESSRDFPGGIVVAINGGRGRGKRLVVMAVSRKEAITGVAKLLVT
jgi:hypothetical protein